MIEIPTKAVDKIIEWNTGIKRDDIRYDKKVCQSLLLSLVAKKQLQESVVDADVMRFIKGKNVYFFFFLFLKDSLTFLLLFLKTDCFNIRCGNNGVRIDAIEAYKAELGAELCKPLIDTPAQ